MDSFSPGFFDNEKGSLSEVQSRYSKSGVFRARCGFGDRPVVLVIDFVKYATDPKAPMYGGPIIQKAIKETAKLLGEARRRNVPIIYTTVGWKKNFEKEFGVFGSKLPSLKLVKIGEPWAEICDEVKPDRGEPIIVKHTSSAFLKTRLLSLLHRMNVDTVIITGHSTSACVRTSACDAIQNGFHTIVVKDCVGDRAQVVHDSNLFDLDSKFADVISLDETLQYFQRFPRKETQSVPRTVSLVNQQN